MTQHKSNSAKRLEVERFVINQIKKDNPRLEFTNDSLSEEGVKFDVDLYDTGKTKFYEIYSGIKDLKPGQKRKLLTDILKLNLIEKLLGEKIEKNIVLVDHRIEKKLNGVKNSWASMAISQFDINIIVIDLKDLDKPLYKELEADKRRQKMS